MRAFAADKIKIGYSQCTLNHPWRVAQTDGNRIFCEKNYPDVELIITDGNNDSGKQVSDIESLLAQDIKVLMVAPLTADALTPIVKQAMESGIAVVALDREVNTKVTCHIGAIECPDRRRGGGPARQEAQRQGRDHRAARHGRRFGDGRSQQGLCRGAWQDARSQDRRQPELRLHARQGRQVHGRHGAALRRRRDSGRVRAQ